MNQLVVEKNFINEVVKLDFNGSVYEYYKEPSQEEWILCPPLDNCQCLTTNPYTKSDAKLTSDWCVKNSNWTRNKRAICSDSEQRSSRWSRSQQVVHSERKFSKRRLHSMQSDTHTPTKKRKIQTQSENESTYDLSVAIEHLQIHPVSNSTAELTDAYSSEDGCETEPVCKTSSNLHYQPFPKQKDITDTQNRSRQSEIIQSSADHKALNMKFQKLKISLGGHNKNQSYVFENLLVNEEETPSQEKTLVISQFINHQNAEIRSLSSNIGAQRSSCWSSSKQVIFSKSKFPKRKLHSTLSDSHTPTKKRKIQAHYENESTHKLSVAMEHLQTDPVSNSTAKLTDGCETKPVYIKDMQNRSRQSDIIHNVDDHKALNMTLQKLKIALGKQNKNQSYVFKNLLVNEEKTPSQEKTLVFSQFTNHQNAEIRSLSANTRAATRNNNYKRCAECNCPFHEVDLLVIKCVGCKRKWHQDCLHELPDIVAGFWKCPIEKKKRKFQIYNENASLIGRNYFSCT